MRRMLEAAMLGIPYEGTIPDFAAEAARPMVPPSSESLAGRSVRQEQDWAYEQSLQVHSQSLLMYTANHFCSTQPVPSAAHRQSRLLHMPATV